MNKTQKYKIKIKRFRGLYAGTKAYVTDNDGQEVIFDNPIKAKRYAIKMFGQATPIDIVEMD